MQGIIFSVPTNLFCSNVFIAAIMADDASRSCAYYIAIISPVEIRGIPHE